MPRLEEIFDQIDAEIDDLLVCHPAISVTREEFIRRRIADPEWLELAGKLGSPVP